MSVKAALPASLSSAEDIQEAIDGLRLLARGGGLNSRSSLSEPLRELYDAGRLADSHAIAEAVAWFEKTIADAPRVGVTLAGPLDAGHKAQLTAWFRTNVAPDVIVSFSHNRSLLGGVLVRAGSRMYDWSYRSRLLDSPVSFTKVLHDVR